MNNNFVPSESVNGPEPLLAALAKQLDELTPELRKAATFILEQPNEVGVSSLREMAVAANVKPNTFVRMARSLGFDGFDDFREPFREEIRQGRPNFQDRARWLQALAEGGELSKLYAEMASSAIGNIEQTFASTDMDQVKLAADAIVAANRSFVMGVGVNHALARNFAYLADMAVDSVQAIPRGGSSALDELARGSHGDLLLAITCKPYRSEVVAAVDQARQQGMTIIGISDSPASPIVVGSEFGFVVRTETPAGFSRLL